MVSSPVEKILIEKRGGRRYAIGVRLEGGAELRAGRIVSNATPNITYDRLVGREHLSPHLCRKLDRTTYSLAAISLCLVTDLDLNSMGMDSGNYWYAPDKGFESVFASARDVNSINDEYPCIFFGVTTIKDPTGFNNGRHTIEAVRFLTYDAFKPYEGSTHGNRPKEYEALKDKLTSSMVRSIGRIIPGIEDHVLHSELGTPLTFDHYVRSTRGACYGTEKVLKQLGPFSFKQASEIKNLYLCGASILHGVSGATTSGLMLTAAIKGCRPSELLKTTGQELRIIDAGPKKSA